MGRMNKMATLAALAALAMPNEGCVDHSQELAVIADVMERGDVGGEVDGARGFVSAEVGDVMRECETNLPDPFILGVEDPTGLVRENLCDQIATFQARTACFFQGDNFDFKNPLERDGQVEVDYYSDSYSVYRSSADYVAPEFGFEAYCYYQEDFYDDGFYANYGECYSWHLDEDDYLAANAEPDYYPYVWFLYERDAQGGAYMETAADFAITNADGEKEWRNVGLWWADSEEIVVWNPDVRDWQDRLSQPNMWISGPDLDFELACDPAIKEEMEEVVRGILWALDNFGVDRDTEVTP